MGNRSRHKSRIVRAARPPMPLGQIMRTHCTECGSPVEWITADEALDREIDLGPALQFLGVSESEEIWACTVCDNYGVMGPTEYGAL